MALDDMDRSEVKGSEGCWCGGDGAQIHIRISRTSPVGCCSLRCCISVWLITDQISIGVTSDVVILA